MTMRIDVYHHFEESASTKTALTRIEHLIKEGFKDTMAGFERLTTEVQENGDAIQSAITLLGGLSQEIRDAAGNEEESNALADRLDANTNSLAQAVVDNTPAGGGGDTPPTE